MKRVALAMAVAVSLAAGAASVTTAAPSEHRVTFTAHLTGAAEEPSVDTDATGQAVIRLDRSGTSLHYRLIVANLDDVLQAHIHVAPEGVNGPVVAFLYPSAPPAVLIPGRTDGILATGTITADDLRGPLAGMSLSDLEEAIRSGNAYVNVHTVANPGGEVRGQIG